MARTKRVVAPEVAGEPLPAKGCLDIYIKGREKPIHLVMPKARAAAWLRQLTSQGIKYIILTAEDDSQLTVAAEEIQFMWYTPPQEGVENEIDPTVAKAEES